ncbi:MAG: FHA domain-containing protein [Muribaculaceae bacterium]|nr:FHA domain-containing protein [Muribaculaceae bacterium]
MRCKNCGWPNKPGATNCSKCNSPLGEVQVPVDPEPQIADVNATVLNEPEPQQAAPAPVETPAPVSTPRPRSLGGAPLGGTVFENEAFPEAAPQPSAPAPAAEPVAQPVNQPAPQDRPTVCPKCGYPLRPDTDKCPNCRFQVKAPQTPGPAPESPAAPAETANQGFRRQATVGAQEAFQKPSSSFSGTVNPLVQRIVPEFQLTLQPREGERLSKTKLDFEGESVSLNRDKLEPGNNSITSREQARITCEDGKWYIEDKSQFQTTFVRAGRKTEIKDGDIILMGSRLFVFNTDSAE